MTNIKLKAVNPDFSFLTKGKVYSVDKVDEDGDYVIYDDDGYEYYVRQCEIGKDNEWEKVSGFDKLDLLNGDVIVMRNGYKYIFFKNYAGKSDALVNTKGGWMNLDKYEVNLLFANDSAFDILEVHRPVYCSAFYPAHEFYNYECVFKREDRKKMTVEDIEAALGYKIEVIDNE